MRTFNTSDAEQLEEYFDIDSSSWIADADNNILLVDSRGNLAAFEKKANKTFEGHYFFKDRGKQAVDAALSFLDEMRSMPEVSVIIGIVPLINLGARWLTRKIGFSSQGIVETQAATSELFLLVLHEN
jgi:hypothetical protein